MQVVVDHDDVVARVKRYYVKSGIEDALAKREADYEPGDFYRPIEVVVSASNECKVLCRQCGLNTVAYGSARARRLSTETIVRLLDEAVGEGFLSYLCSFEAEPFVNLPLLTEIVARFRGRLDPSKVNTSCSEFSSLRATISLMSELKRSGWAETSFLVPVVSLSLGLQQDIRNGSPVPLGNVINGIIGFHEIFNHRHDATLAISHYYDGSSGMELAERLATEFAAATHDDLADYAIIKSREVIGAGRAKSGIRPKPIGEAVNVKNCFKLSFEMEYLNPTLEVDSAANLSRRSMCCYHSLGQYPSTSLADAVRKINSDPFFRLHSNGGTKAIYDFLIPLYPRIAEESVVDGHHACSVLRETITRDPHLLRLLHEHVADVAPDTARES